ncbi:MAG: hypothetical protein IPK82_16855 [Polyangiaceae bacterium]|nr:hypothetical protein [Polyangiaceae bacterium]
MKLDDEQFDAAVDQMRTLAAGGAHLEEVLIFSRTHIAARMNTVASLVAFQRAFGIPLTVAACLGVWEGFHGENPPVSGESLEAEFGEQIRSAARSLSIKRNG